MAGGGSISFEQNSQRKLFENLDKVKINFPKFTYDGIVAFLLTARMNAMNKIKHDRHIVTSRLRNSIYVQSHTKESALKVSKTYRDNENNSHDAELKSIQLDTNEAAFGTNVEYAEKIERLDSFIYWGFKHADNKELSKEFNRQVNKMRL